MNRKGKNDKSGTRRFFFFYFSSDTYNIISVAYVHVLVAVDVPVISVPENSMYFRFLLAGRSRDNIRYRCAIRTADVKRYKDFYH